MLQTPENCSCWFIPAGTRKQLQISWNWTQTAKLVVQVSIRFFRVFFEAWIHKPHFVFSRDWTLELSYTILKDRGPVQRFPQHSRFLPCWPWSINSCSPTRATWGTRSGWLCSAGNIQSSFITFPATSTTSSLIQTSPETKILSGLHIITAMAKSWYFTGPGLSTTNFLEGWKEFKQSIVIKVIIDDFL